MTEHIDVRMARAQLPWLDARHYTVLADLEQLGLRRIDLRPPASGPEVELAFEGDHDQIVEQLKAWGYDVLASRARP